MKITRSQIRRIIKEASEPAGNVIGYIDADIDGDYRYNQKLEVFHDSSSDVITVVVKDSAAVGGMDYHGPGEGRSNYHISGTRVLPPGASGKDLIAAIKGAISRTGDTIKRYGRPTKNFSWAASKWDPQGPKGLNAKLANAALQKSRGQMSEASIRFRIKQLLLREEHQTIIQNPYEDVDDYNVLANYALTGDIAGALADPALKPYVDNNEMGFIADEAIGWFSNVGEEGYNMPAPEGWDSNKAYQFLRDIEDAAYDEYSKAMKARISSDPDTAWLRFLGNQFTAGIEPSDMEGIKWKKYKKYVRLSPPPSISHGIGEITVSMEDYEWNSDKPGTWDDFIDFLERRAGGQLGRRKPYKRSPGSYYD